jgi:hypothetical protein
MEQLNSVQPRTAALRPFPGLRGPLLADQPPIVSPNPPFSETYPGPSASGKSPPVAALKIPESGLLFICFADIRRGAAGCTDCCSRMAGLQGFFAFA